MDCVIQIRDRLSMADNCEADLLAREFRRDKLLRPLDGFLSDNDAGWIHRSPCPRLWRCPPRNSPCNHETAAYRNTRQDHEWIQSEPQSIDMNIVAPFTLYVFFVFAIEGHGCMPTLCMQGSNQRDIVLPFTPNRITIT